jgi:hypothetical protein
VTIGVMFGLPRRAGGAMGAKQTGAGGGVRAIVAPRWLIGWRGHWRLWHHQFYFLVFFSSLRENRGNNFVAEAPGDATSDWPLNVWALLPISCYGDLLIADGADHLRSHLKDGVFAHWRARPRPPGGAMIDGWLALSRPIFAPSKSS